MSKTIRPIDATDAENWEQSARQFRMNAERAIGTENRLTWLREADEAEEFASRIRRVLAGRAA